MSFKQILANFAKKLTTIAQKVPQVYEAGKLAEHDRFWDSYQENGNRVRYQTAYAGIGWNNNTFKPPYNMNPTHAYMMFRDSVVVGDLTKILADLGISLDFSNCTNLQYAFYSCKFTKIGLVDFSKITSDAISVFGYSADLESVEIKVNENTKFNGTFTNCTALINLVIHGTIGQNGFNVQWSTKLNKASHLSIFGCISTTASITVTFSKVAVNKAFETAPGANDGSKSQEWNDLVDTRPNATIVLA